MAASVLAYAVAHCVAGITLPPADANHLFIVYQFEDWYSRKRFDTKSDEEVIHRCPHTRKQRIATSWRFVALVCFSDDSVDCCNLSLSLLHALARLYASHVVRVRSRRNHSSARNAHQLLIHIGALLKSPAWARYTEEAGNI